MVSHEFVERIKFHDPQKIFAVSIAEYLEVLDGFAEPVNQSGEGAWLTWFAY